MNQRYKGAPAVTACVQVCGHSKRIPRDSARVGAALRMQRNATLVPASTGCYEDSFGRGSTNSAQKPTGGGAITLLWAQGAAYRKADPLGLWGYGSPHQKVDSVLPLVGQKTFTPLSRTLPSIHP